MDMQKQPDSSSCGLFAIAVATALTHGLDPVKLKWDVSKMRRHLQDCLETRKLTNFPSRIREKSLLGLYSFQECERSYLLHLSNALGY